MRERFTERARKVMELANEEAQLFNHDYIGTEHILLGLIKEGSGIAANALKCLDVDLRKIRLEVERIVQSGPDMVRMRELIMTPRAAKVVEYAMEECRNLNHNYVGTEHLLLGLLRDQEGVAAQVLMNLGLKMEDVREEVLNILGYQPDSQAGDAGGRVLISALRHIPDEAKRVLAQIDALIEKLAMQKEDAIAEQDFVRAAELRDIEGKVKRQLFNALRKLLSVIAQSEDESD